MNISREGASTHAAVTKGAAVDLHRLPTVAFQLDMAPMLLGVECMLPVVPTLHGASVAAKFGASQVSTLIIIDVELLVMMITIDVGHSLAVHWLMIK
jgi:hypothetical protein